MGGGALEGHRAAAGVPRWAVCGREGRKPYTEEEEGGEINIGRSMKTVYLTGLQCECGVCYVCVHSFHGCNE